MLPFQGSPWTNPCAPLFSHTHYYYWYKVDMCDEKSYHFTTIINRKLPVHRRLGPELAKALPFLLSELRIHVLPPIRPGQPTRFLYGGLLYYVVDHNAIHDVAAISSVNKYNTLLPLNHSINAEWVAHGWCALLNKQLHRGLGPEFIPGLTSLLSALWAQVINATRFG